MLNERQLAEGAWLDIALTKKTAEGTTAISKTDMPVLFAIEVPSALRADGRSYALIRSHEGDAAVVSKDSGVVLNAESDEFSTYVIAYGDNPPSPVAPTGDSVPRAAHCDCSARNRVNRHYALRLQAQNRCLGRLLRCRFETRIGLRSEFRLGSIAK